MRYEKAFVKRTMFNFFGISILDMNPLGCLGIAFVRVNSGKLV